MKLLALVLLISPAFAQRGGRGGGASAPAAAPEEGIPVTDALVIGKCSGCHTKDSKGNLTRISWVRTTPEGWEEAIKRMVRLNGVELTPEEARAIVKSLSATHGLAPEEARPVMYMPEGRMIDETFSDDTVRSACASCHPIGRPRSWRRSKEEWTLLATTHSGLFPDVDFQAFYRFRPPADQPPPQGQDMRQPLDVALEYFSKDFSLNTPEWAAWRARMRPPKIAGRWIVSGYQPGRGKVIGEMRIAPHGDPDQFSTTTKLTYLKDGATLALAGNSVVYTGYSWRGRSDTGDEPHDNTSTPRQAREVMWIAPDQSTMEGRWFWGAYQEFGIDVKLQRVDDPAESAMVLATDLSMLKTGSVDQRVRIFGDHLAGVRPMDVDFGTGVTVKRIIADASNASVLTVDVDVDAHAIVGKRDVSVRRSVAANAIAVYDRIDYIKVKPDTALARLGGNGHPKGFQQFEAWAYNRGPDDKPNTADDVELGPVPVEWSVEEFYAVYGDDDKSFVGQLSAAGFFTPASEGPNPERKFSRNNYGDVWVVATYKDATGADGRPMTAKSYLVVTVPLYVQWDQPEVAPRAPGNH
jgi:quinohemoprotein amine dehydrogenase